MSLVLLGSTSGSVTLQEPAIAGSTVIDLPATSGTMAVLPTATSVLPEASGGTGTTTGYYGFKNRIINGAMVINQRATSITDAGFVTDRWQYTPSLASKATISQDTSVYPTGFNASLKVLSSSAYTVGASELFIVRQAIEGFNVADLGWGFAGAQPVTISFWVRSSLTGTFGGAVENLGINRCYVFSYSIPTANTWTQITITIAGDTTGTWNTTNDVGIRVSFGLGVGSSFSGTAGSWGSTRLFSATGAVSVVGTNAATWYITGVQLEKGSTATSFDYRPYSAELALCQRYYQKTSVSAGYKYITSLGSGVNGTLARANYQLKTSLRDTPTAVDYSNIAVDDNAAVTAITSVTIFSASADSVGLNLVAASGLTQYRPYFGTSNASAGYIGISAEL
jgi:hypothetical protein